MKRVVKIENGFRTMRPKNKAEAQCFDRLHDDGWTLTKSGWPDFFCTKDGKIMCVEVKPKSEHALKTNQQGIMELLAAYGVPCYKWSPDGGMEEVPPKKIE